MTRIVVLDQSPRRVIVVRMDASLAVRLGTTLVVCAAPFFAPTVLKADRVPEVGLAIGFSSVRSISQAVESAALAEANRIWAPANVTIGSTADDDAADDLQTVDVVEARTSTGHGLHHELAEVLFTDGVPAPRIAVHVDALHKMIAETMQVRFPRFEPPVPLGVLIWGQTLGRVLAHEIGHYLLRFPHHERDGLMRAVHWTTDFSDLSGKAFRLTRWDVDRLRGLIAAGVVPTMGRPRKARKTIE